jgi:lipooligosaccharide transport system permease protein
MIAHALLRRGIQISGRRAPRLIERNLYVYRRTWIILFSGFFEPLFYLLGIGYGVGSLVGTITLPGGQHVTYALFVAPALMASSAMNGGIYESMFNMFFKLKHARLYDAILTTPIGVMDVAFGEILWAVFRGSLYSVGFIVVMVALHLVSSWWAVLALPAATTISFAFAAVGTATSSFMRKWQDFDIAMLVLIPLFLFSATFYPITVYPPAIRAIVELSPLYHGVVLIRALTTGAVSVSLLPHLAYLLAMGLAGLLVASRRLGILLLK